MRWRSRANSCRVSPLREPSGIRRSREKASYGRGSPSGGECQSGLGGVGEPTEVWPLLLLAQFACNSAPASTAHIAHVTSVTNDTLAHHLYPPQYVTHLN